MGTSVRAAQAAVWRDWLELMRPFSLTTGLVAVAAGSAAAWSRGHAHLAALPLVVLGTFAIQAGTNVINEVHDVAGGLDTEATPRASRAILEGRIAASAALPAGMVLLLAGVAAGAGLTALFGLGPTPLLLGLLGALLGYAYTAPPVALKYRGLGLPVIALVMGPVMTLGAQFAQGGGVSAVGLWASLPVGLLVGCVGFGNDLRDADTDAAAGARSVATVLGPRWGWRLYAAMMIAAYVLAAAGVVAGHLPREALAAFATGPMAVRLLGTGAQWRAHGAPAVATLDQRTAHLQLAFGLLITVGLALAGARF